MKITDLTITPETSTHEAVAIAILLTSEGETVLDPGRARLGGGSAIPRAGATVRRPHCAPSSLRWGRCERSGRRLAGGAACSAGAAACSAGAELSELAPGACAVAWPWHAPRVAYATDAARRAALDACPVGPTGLRTACQVRGTHPWRRHGQERDLSPLYARLEGAGLAWAWHRDPSGHRCLIIGPAPASCGGGPATRPTE